MVGIAIILALAFVIFRTSAGPTDRELARRERADWPRQDRAWSNLNCRRRREEALTLPWRNRKYQSLLTSAATIK